ncbi:MAG: hydrogenase subunit MbhD domain-containing protein [Cyanobacteria bacterium P01_D01_bin.73]
MTEAMTDWDVVAIAALLPIAAVMTTLQKNPYHALVVRGILGAIAALVYALLGAADVALTEALVGTMLAITLYAVAVRSSLVLKLGIVDPVEPLLEDLRTFCDRHSLRLELHTLDDRQALDHALETKEVHAIALPTPLKSNGDKPYALTVRVPRLHELMQTELNPAIATLASVAIEDPAPTVSPTPPLVSDSANR